VDRHRRTVMFNQQRMYAVIGERVFTAKTASSPRA
jgi:hypothetical protein